MDTLDLERTRQRLARDFDWEEGPGIETEEELIQLLAQHIAWMIDHRSEQLFSLMYRLDVAEHKLRMALHPSAVEAPARALARLVVERHKERLATRNRYRQDDLGEEAW